MGNSPHRPRNNPSFQLIFHFLGTMYALNPQPLSLNPITPTKEYAKKPGSIILLQPYSPTFHVMFHVVFHSSLNYWAYLGFDNESEVWVFYTPSISRYCSSEALQNHPCHMAMRKCKPINDPDAQSHSYISTTPVLT